MLWGAAGLLPQQESSNAMEHPGTGRHGLLKGPSVTHVTGHPGTPVPGSVALQVLTPQLPCSSLLGVQPCQVPGLLHRVLQ